MAASMQVLFSNPLRPRLRLSQTSRAYGRRVLYDS